MKNFNIFAEGIKSDYKYGCVIQNPSYYNKLASDELSSIFRNKLSSHSYDKAIEYSEKSINLDEGSFIPYYHKAIAKIRNADLLIGSTNTKYVDYRKNAIKDFEEIIKKLDEEIKSDSVILFYSQTHCQNNISISENKIHIYLTLKNLMIDNIKELNNSITSDKKFFTFGQKHVIIKDIEISSIFNEKYPQEIKNLKDKGLTNIYVVNERSSGWNCFLVAILGISQISIGLYFLAGVGGTGLFASFLTGLVSEGIADIIKSFSSAYSGDFNWKEFGIEKIISSTLLLINVGFSSYISLFEKNYFKELIAQFKNSTSWNNLANKKICEVIEDGFTNMCSAKVNPFHTKTDVSEKVYNNLQSTLFSHNFIFDKFSKLPTINI